MEIAHGEEEQGGAAQDKHGGVAPDPKPDIPPIPAQFSDVIKALVKPLPPKKEEGEGS